jgi:hypothetical protein
MKTGVVVLFALLLLVISVGGWMIARPNPLRVEVVRLEKKLREADIKILQLEERLLSTAKEDALESLKKNAGPAVQMSNGPSVSVSRSSAEGSETKVVTSELLNTPGMREMIKHQNWVKVDKMYGPLFDLFQLNPAEKENFRRLLAARLDAETEIFLRGAGENVSVREKLQMGTDLDNAEKASDELIKIFLGNDDDFKTFEEWEDEHL